MESLGQYLANERACLLTNRGPRGLQVCVSVEGRRLRVGVERGRLGAHVDVDGAVVVGAGSQRRPCAGPRQPSDLEPQVTN